MRPGTILPALFAALLCSCARGPAPRPDPSPGARPEPVVLSTPAVRTMPAAAIVRRPSDCTALAPAEQSACYQALLDATLRRGGIDSAMALLDSLDRTQPVVRDNNHMYAHMLGLAAYTTPAEVASVFSRCSPNFQSGCYHGVIQAYFLDLMKRSPGSGISATQINALCADFRRGDARWLLFQCVHGIGHGLEAIHGHDLKMSLEGCDLLSSAWERSGCYGGAFMENVISITNPHQTAEGMTGHGSAAMDHMAGMEMEGMDDSSGPEPAFKRFEPEDLNYPCSALDARYGAECYMMQTSLMLYLRRGDFARVAAACDSAPAGFRTRCFASLGRDANSYARGDAERAAEYCAAAPVQYRPWCHSGVAANRVDITSRPKDGFDYCARLSDAPSRAGCFVTVGREIGVLADSRERRTAMCSGAAERDRAACFYGAQIRPEWPAALPSGF